LRAEIIIIIIIIMYNMILYIAPRHKLRERIWRRREGSETNRVEIYNTRINCSPSKHWRSSTAIFGRTCTRPYRRLDVIYTYAWPRANSTICIIILYYVRIAGLRACTRTYARALYCYDQIIRTWRRLFLVNLDKICRLNTI